MRGWCRSTRRDSERARGVVEEGTDGGRGFGWTGGPLAPSEATWACHGACGDYTNWTLVPDDIGRVPQSDVPEAWGSREEWFALVREEIARRARERERPRRARVDWVGYLAAAAIVCVWAIIAVAVGGDFRGPFDADDAREVPARAAVDRAERVAAAARAARAVARSLTADHGGANISRADAARGA